MIHFPDLVGWSHYEAVCAVRMLRAAGRGEGDQAAARRRVEREHGAEVLERAQRFIAEEPPLPVLAGEWEVPR